MWYPLHHSSSTTLYRIMLMKGAVNTMQTETLQTQAHKQQYGTWESRITPQMLAGSLRLSDVQWDTDGKTLVWHEVRDGRGVLVAQTGTEAPRDLTDSSLNVRAGVGYGGGEFTVANGFAFFSANGRLYRMALTGGTAKALTPQFGAVSSPAVSPHGEWVAYVYSYEGRDGLALVDTEGEGWPIKLAWGNDFFMQPTWHPDGMRLAYITWDYPQMPFTGTELRLITLEYSEITSNPYCRAVETLDGDTTTAIFQPQFSPDGRYLAYISDASGFGHLYLYDFETNEHQQITQGAYEHGTPAWVQGMRRYAWAGNSAALYYIREQAAFARVYSYDVVHQVSFPVSDLAAYSTFEQIALTPAQDANEKLALVASASTIPQRILSYSAEDGVRVVRRATTESIPAADLAPAEPLQWAGHDGETVHGLYYAPTNSAYEGIGLPPLIVSVHGGPTSHRRAEYKLDIQFFASRGYAVLQVNHRGSTGYGRAYMDKHHLNWGVYDVEDSASGAQYLIEQGRVDPHKVVIMGGSAGGYTVLQSLIDKPGFYKAGVNLFGVADHFALARDTHKFEARYTDWLLGELPDAAETYRARSPIFHADKIRDALIVFQGAEDNVVPRSQSDAIVAAVKRNGIPHEYHVYEGEGHGWRQPETIQRYYESLLTFLETQVLYT